jgi:mannitol-1-phosphate 5-dehydrogenase
MEKLGLVFGAGSIGKSVAGYVLNMLGFRTVFVDISLPMVNDINRRNSYRVLISEDANSATDIRNVEAIHISDKKALLSIMCKVNYIFTAVGFSGLDTVFQVISEGIKERISNNDYTSVFLLLCENHSDISAYAFQKLRGKLNPEELNTVIIIGTSIERMARPFVYDGVQFDVIAEAFYPVIFSAVGVPTGELLFNNPQLFSPVNNLNAYYYRKLYTNNLGHAVLGYMGFQHGYQSIVEALEDREIQEVLQKALEEAGSMLIKKFGFGKEDMDQHIAELITVRYANRGLNDSIGRVARDPIRKLGGSERLIGAASLCIEHGIYPDAIIKTIKYALKYENPDDSQSMELSRLLGENGIDYVLQYICGLKSQHPLYCALVDRIKNGALYTQNRKVSEML